MGEHDQLIQELIDAGATEQEIVAILDQKIAEQKSQPSGASLDPRLQREINKKAVGSALPMGAGALLDVPVLGDLAYSTGMAAQSAITDQLPQSLAQSSEAGLSQIQ